jgi:hypothetical protein
MKRISKISVFVLLYAGSLTVKSQGAASTLSNTAGDLGILSSGFFQIMNIVIGGGLFIAMVWSLYSFMNSSQHAHARSHVIGWVSGFTLWCIIYAMWGGGN